MLELMSWQKVPPARERDRKAAPSNFERWSLIKETPDEIRKENAQSFYRWRYDQPRIADELDQGTCDAPTGLPYGDEIKVVNTLEKLTSNTLDANMIATPGWAVHRDEIRAHRPLISFIPGHSRTVAGYTESRISILGELPYMGLLVYDPWPPTDCDHPEAGGTITRWENFRTRNLPVCLHGRDSARLGHYAPALTRPLEHAKQSGTAGACRHPGRRLDAAVGR
jgi:hypothetical protein